MSLISVYSYLSSRIECLGCNSSLLGLELCFANETLLLVLRGEFNLEP